MGDVLRFPVATEEQKKQAAENIAAYRRRVAREKRERPLKNNQLRDQLKELLSKKAA